MGENFKVPEPGTSNYKNSVGPDLELDFTMATWSFNPSTNDTGDVNNTSSPVKEIPTPDWLTGLTVTWLILSLFAVTMGNVIVMCVIVREDTLHKARYWFHFNLAVTDLLQGVITIPTAVASLVNNDNPLVYNFRSEEFHRAFLKLFGLSVPQIAPLP
ncbi:hypothetical protein Bbelb_351560 [Branchiostoma belcheri]|nr:hypothetical protein Bbelb_351560 [Branchiostoma belcheri]